MRGRIFDPQEKLSEHIKQIIEQYGGNVDLQKRFMN